MSGSGETGNVLFLDLLLATKMCPCYENSLIGALVNCVWVFCVYVTCQQKSLKMMRVINTI